MDLLLAFLGFSATMIVFSTMASVVVEFIHKMFRQRKRDFARMLTNYYEDSVKPLVANKANLEAEKFVEEIRQNPAFASEANKLRWWKPSFLFDTSFENLKTPEFVEQLARSSLGQEIRKTVKKGEKALIEQLASEFERYGDAAHDYFRRRAQVISLLVAMLLALVMNIDAVRLFQALAKDSGLARSVASQINPEEWEVRLASSTDPALDATKIEEVFKENRDQIKNDIALLTSMSLPIGHNYFPNCSDNGKITKVVAGKKSEDHVDPLCVPHLKTKGFFGQLESVFSTWDFWAWVFKSLLAGLLIGLGAPFWFKTYRFLADFVPGIRRGPTTETRDALIQSQNNPSSVTTQATVDIRTDPAAVPAVVDQVIKPLNQSRINTLFMSAAGKKIDEE